MIPGLGCRMYKEPYKSIRKLQTIQEKNGKRPNYVTNRTHELLIESEVAQSCPTLCDPMGCSLPGSFIHGILQARILEWVAISFSRGSSQPTIKLGLLHWGQILYCLRHQGIFVCSYVVLHSLNWEIPLGFIIKLFLISSIFSF